MEAFIQRTENLKEIVLQGGCDYMKSHQMSGLLANIVI